MRKQVAIIGAGVIGLASALKLQQQGYDVTIFARDIDDNMASRIAPAFWIPFIASPEDLILKWAAQSLAVYQALDHTVGVQLLPYEEFHTQKAPLPLWAKIVKEYAEIPPEHLPAPYTCGYSGHLFLIDSSLYLDHLLENFKQQGGQIHQQTFEHLQDVPEKFSIIINCCGLSATTLVPDPECYPIRGQYVLTEKPKDFNKITFAFISEDKNNYTLIVPRVNDCWLGGTTNEGDWNTQANETTTNEILQNAHRMQPSLQGMKTLKVGVGLRPGRALVRVEAEQKNNKTIIHNYGHGGAGFTTCWGCAEEVVELVQQHT